MFIALPKEMAWIFLSIHNNNNNNNNNQQQSFFNPHFGSEKHLRLFIC